MVRRVEALKVAVETDRWLPNRQPVRTLSMPLSIERNRSEENCRFCLIRQLGSSLSRVGYYGRIPFAYTSRFIWLFFIAKLGTLGWFPSQLPSISVRLKLNMGHEQASWTLSLKAFILE